MQLLKQTAFISNKVDTRLLKIFTNTDYEEILDKAIKLSYLEEETNKISFVKQHIYSILKDCLYQDRKYYLHLSDCIKVLYPSRYDLQMQFLYRGKLNLEADKMFLIYLISYYRENSMEYQLNSTDKDRLSSNRLFETYEQICLAYKYYKTKEYNEAENILTCLYCDILEFRFEKDYLLSLIVSNKYYTSENYLERIDVLNTYNTEEFRVSFPEMYMRAHMMLAEFYAEIRSEAELRKCLTEISKCFAKYSSTDKQMQCYEHCFKLKANAFYKIEMAAKYTKESYEFFKRDENRQIYVSKYYLSLLNYSANEIVLGEYKKAYDLLLCAYDIVKKYPHLKSVHEDILLNNLAISGYHCNTFSARECATNIKEITTYKTEQADNLLLLNNQAVFLALDGDFEAALDISNSLYYEIQYNDDIDEYYRYYILNNYGILNWILKNDYTNILEDAFSLCPLPRDRAYFIAHADAVKNLIQTVQPDILIQDTQWNHHLCLQKPKTVGLAWKFWGNLLLLSELQIWSDY